MNIMYHCTIRYICIMNNTQQTTRVWAYAYTHISYGRRSVLSIFIYYILCYILAVTAYNLLHNLITPNVVPTETGNIYTGRSVDQLHDGSEVETANGSLHTLCVYGECVCLNINTFGRMRNVYCIEIEICSEATGFRYVGMYHVQCSCNGLKWKRPTERIW